MFCITTVGRGCGLYNLPSAVESIDILLSAVESFDILLSAVSVLLLIEFSEDSFSCFVVDEVCGDISVGILFWFDGPLSVAGVRCSFIW